MKAAIDTNVFVYAEQDGTKQAQARAVLDGAPSSLTVLPVQVCGELFNVLTRKVGLDRTAAVTIVDQWRDTFIMAATTDETLGAALELSTDHKLSIWDAVILSAASEAECDLLLSEDMQAGFRWRGVTVVNPFAEPISPLLDAFLAQR